MAEDPDFEVQRAQEEFLAERARQRALMIEQAGFSPVLPDEDRRAGEILARVTGGFPTTSEERLYLRRKLFAVPGGDEYVPAPIRTLPSEDKLLLDARLMILDRAAGKP